MSPTSRSRSRTRTWAVSFLAAALVASVTDCADGSAQENDAIAMGGNDDAAVRVTLLVGDDGVATATLARTRAAREFAEVLPVTIEMQDRFAQAKTGALPRDLPYADIGRVLDPTAGSIYYWPADGTIAVVTADLGPSIPPPGLVVLGAVDSGLDALLSAGNRFEMTIEPAA